MIGRSEVANACAPKVQLLPICKEEQNQGSAVLPGGVISPSATANGQCLVPAPLIPAPSTIYVAMDKSAVMHDAFGKQGKATALSLSFNDPVFKRTYAGFQFLPGLDADCSGPTTSFTTLAVPFGLASAA